MAALKLSGGYFGLTVVLSLASELGVLPDAAQRAAALVALGGLVWLACVRTDGGETALLPWRALVHGLPLRGLALVGAVTVLALAVEATPAADWLTGAIGRLDLAGLPPLALYLVFCLAAIFLSAPLSNTVVGTLLYAWPLPRHGRGAERTAVLVRLGRGHCAFMTPIATIGALAFGEMRGTRLTTLLGCGLV
jgi:di/tricarboxylate transporter